tara:strand:- start:666 stop:815 length:150 start_codon:yes stop_codon:yes gene_type:complete
MEYTEYCDVGDHNVEEDEIVRFPEIGATSCFGCQQKMHEDYIGVKRIKN